MAFGLKEIAFVCGAAGLFVYGQQAQMKERAEVVAQHNLTQGEPEAFDSCKSALSRKKLVHGGSTRDFCGCFAKTATGQLLPEHKKLAGSFLERTLDKSDRSLGAEMFTPATYEGLASNGQEIAVGIMVATMRCVDEVRTACDQRDAACVERIEKRAGLASAQQKR